MPIEGIKVQPEHQKFLDSHFGVAPQWNDFQKNLKDKSFVDAIKADTRSDDKLKVFAHALNMRESPGKSAKIPSDVSGSYKVKYHPSEDRFSCSCPDWTYKRSIGGGDCKHIDRMKTSMRNRLMKTANAGPAEVLFRVGRVINREKKEHSVTNKLKAENEVYSATYPRKGFVHQWLKHASDIDMTKKLGHAARYLLTP